jgi:hypothetical protein
MKIAELAELLLVGLYDAAIAQGHAKYQSLDALAAQFGVADRGKVIELARLLEKRGLIDAVINNAGASARILGPGLVLVEQGGETGIIEKYRANGNRLDAPNLGPFPSYPAPSLSHDDVIAFVLECKQKGWLAEVYRKHANHFVLLTPGDNKICVSLGPGEGRVYRDEVGSGNLVGKPENLRQFQRVVEDAVHYFGEEWPARITSGRLAADTPASNVVTISKLLASAEIQAVFDPYLDNHSFAVLLDILALTGSIANDVRFISSIGMTQGKIPRLTKTFVSTWFAERGVTGGEVRLLPDKSEHRRFMLLSGGQSLLLGMSLNSIAKNEAVRLEPDTDDRPFFESSWASAALL